MTRDPVKPDTDAPSSGRKWRFLILLLLAAVLAPGSWLARRSASRMDYFHVRAVHVRGARYLDQKKIVEIMALDTTRSVWDDMTPLARRLDTIPQIAAVAVERRLPGTIVVTIREKQPVALVQGPKGLEPVDNAGVVLPIDLSIHDLDLPIAVQRDVPMLALIGAIRAGTPALYTRIASISRDGKSDVMIHLVPAPGLGGALRVRAPLGVSVSRLADIFPVESDLLRRRANVAELDLRYRDQVIARLQ
ncbi:MAG: FtsQ-type POTRA domain-containing protein [Gemmatimonadaceae bacterium]|nr:FtsQ-type POTRA domain-containing protein [Gemmatimonadaceae bacterium]